MLSEARHSTQSPSESVLTESVRTGPTLGGKRQTSIQSSISEESSNRVPPAPPLPATIRAPLKSPTESSSSSSSSSSQASTTQSQTTQKSKTNGRATNSTKPTPGISLSKPVSRRLSSDEKNKSNRQLRAPTTKTSDTKQKTKGSSVTVSARDLMNDKSSNSLLTNFHNGKSNRSVFEKIDTHNGHATYLGSGTFFDLENCISNCLSKNRSHIDHTYHSSRHDDPCKSLTRASVLEDYSYDGILESKHHKSYSSHSYHHDYDYCHDRVDHHCHYSEHKKHAADLSLDEIRHVNDYLAKYGIPVFSHHGDHHHSHHPHHPHHAPHSAGEIVSACRLLLSEPRLTGLLNNGQQAVQHVWDAIQHHPMPPPNHGYASPALQGVASHLFHPNQTPYDPVHGVASHIFGPPHQAPYNSGPPGGTPHFNPPSQPPPYNPGPPPYNPGPPPYNSGPPPPQNSGQSVLSRLFGHS